MNLRQLLFIAACTTLGATTVLGRYMMPDIEKVPVERLIANLQARLKDKPDDAKLNYLLARVYSIAYAQGAAELQMDKKTQEPYFGPGAYANLPPRETPPAVGGTPNGLRGSATRAYLTEAIKYYTRAAAADPKDIFSQLGLGWCQEQAGDKSAAIAAYRKALDLAWAREKDEPGIFEVSFTEETIRYLTPLLDKEKDAAELAKLKDYQAVINKKGRAMTPILVPLGDETALEALVAPQAAVKFDLDGRAAGRTWGWITPQAGWLVHDPEGEGRITSGLQLVGAVTFWVQWDNGYQALAALDDDRNGWLEGAELTGLALWRDANGNGVSEPGEVRPLAQWGITGLATAHARHPAGIPFSPHGVRLADGGTRPSYDWLAPAQ